MSSFKPDKEIINEILFKLIEQECSKLISDSKLKDGVYCKDGEIYEIKNPAYGFLKVDEIKSIIKSTLSQINKGAINEENVNAYFDYLKRKHYLIPFSDKDYRTIYMDLVSKGAALRVSQETPRYVINPRVSIVYTTIPYPSERHYKLSSEEEKVKPLKDLVRKELGDKAEEYFKVIDEYLGESGLDVIQMAMLKDMIESYMTHKALIVGAPTGFGKTEIFMFFLLFILYKYNFKLPDGPILLLYPRKALATNQLNRIVKLAYILKKYGKDLNVWVRDGDSSTDKRYENAKIFNVGDKIREGSVTCPKGDPMVYKSKKSISCSDPNCAFSKKEVNVSDFRFYLENAEPHIIISNIYTIGMRLLTSSVDRKDLYISNLKFSYLVMDEAHVYHGLFGAIVSPILGKLKELNSNSKFILVSATLPNPKDFTSKLLNVDKKSVKSISYIKYKKEVRGRKLTILLFCEIRPNISWQTYSQIWAVLTTTYSVVYNNSFQSLYFINNVRELNNFMTGFKQNISLGEPCHDRVTDKIDEFHDDNFHIFMDTNTKNNWCAKNGNNSNAPYNISSHLLDKFDIVFMDSKDKYKIFEKIQKGELYGIGATSTLELGVDYDGVSTVLNLGVDDPIEIAQRIGRAGRSSKKPRISVGVIVSKALPIESYRISNKSNLREIVDFIKGKGSKRAKLKITKNVKAVDDWNIVFNTAVRIIEKNVGNEKVDDICKELNNVLKELKSKTKKKSSKSVDLLQEFYSVMCEEKGFNNVDCSSTNEEPLLAKLSDLIDTIRNVTRGVDDLIDILSPDNISEKIEKLKEIKEELIPFTEKMWIYKNDVDSMKKKIDKIAYLAYEASSVLRNIKLPQKYTQWTVRSKIKQTRGEFGKLFNIINEIDYDNITQEVHEYCLLMNRAQSLRNITKFDEFVRKILEYFTTVEIPLFNIVPYSNSKSVNVHITISENNDKEVGSFNVDNLFIRFPPLVVFNYEKYLDSRHKTLTYAVPLPTLYLGKFNYYTLDSNGNLRYPSNLGYFLAIDPRNSGQNEIFLNQISEYKAVDLFYLQGKQQNKLPIVIARKMEKGNSLLSPPYIKIGINSKYFDNYPNSFIKEQKKSLSYSPEILNYARTCYLGYGLSLDPTDINKCPFQRFCKFYNDIYKQQNERTSCKFWIGYSAKITPKTYLDFKYAIYEPLNKINPLYKNPLMSLSILNDTEMYSYADNLLIYIGEKLQSIPIKRIYKPFIRTNVLKLEINKPIAIQILKEILEGDEVLKKIIRLKFFLANGYYPLEKIPLPKSIKRTTNKFTEWINNYNQIIRNKEKDIYEFAFKVLLHTIAHLLHTFIIDRTNLSEEHIYYDYDPQSGSIYIIENSEMGQIGIERVAESLGDLINEFLHFTYRLMKSHRDNLKKDYEILKQQYRKLAPEYFKYAYRIRKIYKDYMRNGLKFDNYSFKAKMSSKDTLRSLNLEKETMEKMLDMIDFATGRSDIDGCSNCVMIDSCKEPVTQHLTVSRRLLTSFLMKIIDKEQSKSRKKYTLKTTFIFSDDSNLGFFLIANMPKKKLELVSAYLDEQGVKTLKDLKGKGIDVKVTVNDRYVPKELIDELRSSLGEENVKLDPKTHEKYYIIDDYIRIDTSWNLEKSNNKQNLVIHLNQ